MELWFGIGFVRFVDRRQNSTKARLVRLIPCSNCDVTMEERRSADSISTQKTPLVWIWSETVSVSGASCTLQSESLHWEEKMLHHEQE